MSWFRRGATKMPEAEAITARWEATNERAREAGCKCGRPATQVRWYGPSATWTCDEHVGVNSWSGTDRGTWLPRFPSVEEAEALARWETAGPRPYTDVDKIRKGTT